MRVLVVDDSGFMRKTISSMLASDPAIEVVGVACNGAEGLEKARTLAPDVITMDIEMPEMDGLTALRRIMSECPTHVIMLSSLTTEGSQAALTALRDGAADVMAKDAPKVSFAILQLKDELVAKVKALGASRKPRRRRDLATKPLSDSLPRGTDPLLRKGDSLPRPSAAAPVKPPVFAPSQFDLLCIGSSTGGPPVVETLICGLPRSIRAPIVIAQHMPELFTRSMAQRLAQVAKREVIHIEQGTRLQPGLVYMCPGGTNTHLKREGTALVASVSRDPAGTIYFPSVSVLLATAAQCLGGRALGVVLTGMGDDGLTGARELHAKGGVLLAQNEESCVVYGMPRAVAHLAAACLAPDGLLAALRTLAPEASDASGSRSAA